MRGYLLDTHAALWWWTQNPRLGSVARELLDDAANRVCLSVASVWEVAIKCAAGRLPELPAFRTEFPRLIDSSAFDLLLITDTHALQAAFLAGDHRDPFDRMIAGQALCEKLTVITKDRKIAQFGCEVIW